MTDTTPAPAATPEPQAGDGKQMEQEQPKTALTPEAQAAELAQARKDAADYRRKLREAEAREAEARKAQEEREKAQAEEQGRYRELYEKEQQARNDAEARLRQLEHDQQRRDAAQAAGIPQLWQRLQGATAEELAEDAQELAAMMQTTQPAPGQPGRQPTQPTPAPQGRNGLTVEEKRMRATRTF